MAASSGTKLKKWEYPEKSGIFIREVLNVNKGDVYGASYMVTVPAKVTGKLRTRKQFAEKSEAEEYAESTFGGVRKQGATYFDASDAERNEWVHALPKLREHGITLSEAVDFAIERLRPSGGQRTISDIVTESVESKRIRFERGDLRERSFRDFRHRAGKFSEQFNELPSTSLGPDDLKKWLLGMKLSPRTTQNYLAVVAEILKFAVQKHYISLSPIDDLTDTDRKELCGTHGEVKEPAILTPEQAERLLLAAHEHSDLGLLGAVTLGLFCGIRTEELKRLDWSNVKDQEENPIVTITGAIAKKRRIRHIDIPENALLWLSLCKNREGPVAENKHTNDYQKRFRKLLEHAKFGHEDKKKEKFIVEWEANAMRHSFGSYHYALHGNPLETSRLLGHKASDQVLFDHYRHLATKKQAKDYFDLKPPARAEKLVKFAS